MITEWQEELISRYPSPFEPVNDTTYIQRKNIREYSNISESEEINSSYICDSRMISKDVYDMFIKLTESPLQEDILNHFSNYEIDQATIITNTEYISALQELTMEV
jgi:hypothetical protein